jgi:hemoglobin
MASQVQQQATPFDLIGGHPAIQRIVERFYDLMDQDPAYAELRALHAPDLSPMRRSLALFLAAWCGGPRDWFEDNPGKCMMSVHKGIPIPPAVAEQWADAMQRAIADCGPENEQLGAEMSELLGRMARSMGR